MFSSYQIDWLIIAFISAILSAASAILQKKVLFNFDALEFSFVLSMFNAIIALFILLTIDLNPIDPYSLIILYLKTIMGAFAFWFVMLAIKNLEISGALPLMVLTPGLVAVFSFLILGESLKLIELAGMLLLLIGTYLMEIRKGGDYLLPFKIFITSKYHHYIIYALILFTFTSIIDKFILIRYDITPISFVGFQQIFLFVNFWIILYFNKKNAAAILKTSNSNILFLILLISITTIGYRYAQIEAIKIAPVALVLSVKRTSVFFASMLGGKLFSEHYLLKKAAAIIFLLIGAYFLT